MIHETHIGFFAHVPGEVYPRGPFRSRKQAEQALANIAARAARAAAPEARQPVPKSEPIEPRVVKATPKGALPRRERKARVLKARHARKVEKRRARPGRVKRADPVAPPAQMGQPE